MTLEKDEVLAVSDQDVSIAILVHVIKQNGPWCIKHGTKVFHDPAVIIVENLGAGHVSDHDIGSSVVVQVPDRHGCGGNSVKNIVLKYGIRLFRPYALRRGPACVPGFLHQTIL